MANNDIKNPRVRIAPSPTGFLHVGTARTALYNYLFAKKHGGEFVLRIEDTDKQRSEEKYEEDVLRHLQWLGLEPDEGPSSVLRKTEQMTNDERGIFGPYRQSERIDIYKKYIERLLAEGKAFYCFHQSRRESQNEEERRGRSQNKNADKHGKEKSGEENPESRVHWCEHKELSEDEVEKRLQAGEEYVIRFRTPRRETVVFEDKVHSEISYETKEIGDFSIAKSKTDPLYNLACVIDDYEMNITHVIRGEDHIPNTPKQILLYQALNLEKPEFAHLPLILGEDKKKLSKRHGSTAVKDYKRKGYLPEALVNFMALLGWHPESDEEVFNLKALTEKFSLARVRPTGAIFNQQKLDWFNKQHLKRADKERIARLSADFLEAEDFLKIKGEEGLFLPNRDLEVKWRWLEKVVELEQKRVKKLSELPHLVDFFFLSSIEYDPQLLVWKDYSQEKIREALKRAEASLKQISEIDFKRETLEEKLLEEANTYDDRGLFLWPLRVALTGKEGSPGPFAVAGLLGKEESEKRVKKAIEKLS